MLGAAADHGLADPWDFPFLRRDRRRESDGSRSTKDVRPGPAENWTACCRHRHYPSGGRRPAGRRRGRGSRPRCGDPAGQAGSRLAENDGSFTLIWSSSDDSVAGFVLGTRVSRMFGLQERRCGLLPTRTPSAPSPRTRTSTGASDRGSLSPGCRSPSPWGTTPSFPRAPPSRLPAWGSPSDPAVGQCDPECRPARARCHHPVVIEACDRDAVRRPPSTGTGGRARHRRTWTMPEDRPLSASGWNNP